MLCVCMCGVLPPIFLWFTAQIPHTSSHDAGVSAHDDVVTERGI